MQPHWGQEDRASEPGSGPIIGCAPLQAWPWTTLPSTEASSKVVTAESCYWKKKKKMQSALEQGCTTGFSYPFLSSLQQSLRQAVSPGFVCKAPCGEVTCMASELGSS